LIMVTQTVEMNLYIVICLAVAAVVVSADDRKVVKIDYGMIPDGERTRIPIPETDDMMVKYIIPKGPGEFPARMDI